MFVQLGDEEVPHLGLLSDIYDVEVTFNDVVWTSRRHANRFLYCENEKAWVLDQVRPDVLSQDDPCKSNWVLKSKPTLSYDIFTLSDTDWFINTDHDINEGGIQMGAVKMKYMSTMSRPKQCPPNYYGPRCNFSKPCERLSIDGQAFNDMTTRNIWGIDDESPVIEYVARASIAAPHGDVIYDLLIDDENLVLVFEAPVYYNKLDSLLVEEGMEGYSSWVNEEHDIYNLLVFIGARWAKLLLAVERHDSKSAEFIFQK